MRVKICGITKPNQGRSIVELGADALGFMCARSSPRYVTPEQICTIMEQLPQQGKRVDCVGVFVNASLAEIQQVATVTQLNVIQLHGQESPEFCAQLKSLRPDLEVIKALRIRSVADLTEADRYQGAIDTLLLDAYHPHLDGGTGQTLDWFSLQTFRPQIPWLLAGGLRPNNVQLALTQLQPNGIDLSSGVESAPGDKDLQKVADLFEQLKTIRAYG